MLKFYLTKIMTNFKWNLRFLTTEKTEKNPKKIHIYDVRFKEGSKYGGVKSQENLRNVSKNLKKHPGKFKKNLETLRKNYK